MDLEAVIKELKTVQKQLDTITTIFMGDPTDPLKPSVLIRLDRLEQSNKLKNKVLMLLATGVMTALGSAIFAAFYQLVTTR